MKKITIWLIASLLSAGALHAQQHRFDPPWNVPPAAGVSFTVPGIDNIPDLYGDIIDPQLVIFFAGNQFMVIDSLITDFKKYYPQYKRVFAETLPPGILAQQILTGSLVTGNLRIDIRPDIYTAGKNRIDQLRDSFSVVKNYAGNTLAIMVQQHNPKQVKGLADLGRSDVRTSMPNPAWEGIGKRIIEAWEKTGGTALTQTIMADKIQKGTTYLTKIHHRETPLRILYDQADAGPVWYTEVYYQQMIGHPVAMVTIPPAENIRASYWAGILKSAPHPQAAKDFMTFLMSTRGQRIYAHFGFTPPEL
ncbi:molybdate ABC transporter substrate-binding protein [Chitinophaga nivalis]|uniref:Substrate-binding domain-containing protein n=1 Tax=Chitinophaga nivalis TaxID=2991709 RepID=A0ABT3IVP2_9BACT|nr:substrate-binding domain-containing protein [Chitinophaga nivalis]MCW3462252.1 substrate-binding domain-containing protein [Chitinophaga nivalis]MCW3488056.1 substrate-binding domain-containing protein [Chitinophaga nivalis]